ncbi:unnamed protein product [Diamesa hyperborea]
MNNLEVEKFFLNLVEDDKNLSNGIAAIKTLLMVLKKTDFTTIQELVNTIKSAIAVIRNSDKPITSVVSACELFICFITLAFNLDDTPMDEIKKIMLNRGQIFLKKLLASRNVISKFAMPFISDGCRILTHSRSRVVLETLQLAAAENKHFHVFVTMSSIDNEGETMIQELKAKNIECTLILDSSIGYIMETIDIIMVGAEGVVESGGIINRIGTYTMALCAKEMKKPFYVLTESFKFSRLYPLNQRDLPNNYKYPKNSDKNADFAKTHPLVDYTPPLNITLIFTDLGILTPSAVSDELIKLY